MLNNLLITMRYLKITSSALIIVFSLAISSWSLKQENLSALVRNQQKHFLPLKANILYLQKSLNSKENIVFPFERIFTVSTSLSFKQSRSLVNFLPTSIKLSKLKHSTHIQFKQKQTISKQNIQASDFSYKKQQGNFSLIDDLRTPFPLQFNEIIVNEEFIFLFIFPNKVVILKENYNVISTVNTYYIDESQRLSLTEMDKQKQNKHRSYSFYSAGDSYVLGFIEETNQFLLFDSKNYTFLHNEAGINNLEHIHFFSDKLDFFTAERQGGFKHCRIDLVTKKIQKIAEFNTYESINFQDPNNKLIDKKNLTIYDITFNPEAFQIYLLDKNLGVIMFKYSPNQTNIISDQIQSDSKKRRSELIIQQKGCQTLDYIHNDRFVLICQDRKRRFFVQAYFSKNSNSFIKQQPVFHNCYFDDLQITPQFYITFDSTSVDIFWPSKSNFIPELVHNKKHINLLGMETFKVKTDNKGNVHIYSVRNNILFKQKISQEKYSLQIGSSQPTKKSFQISVFGNCNELFYNLNQKTQKYSMAFHQNQVDKLNNYINLKDSDHNLSICKIIVPIQFQTNKFIVENRAKMAFSVGIFVICILIAFSLLFICLQKYKGMEKKAKFALKKLQNQQKINPQFVL